MASIYEVFGTDAHAMTLSLMEAANVADMIPDGASVALKPNLVLSGMPDEGATTVPTENVYLAERYRLTRALLYQLEKKSTRNRDTPSKPRFGISE